MDPLENISNITVLSMNTTKNYGLNIISLWEFNGNGVFLSGLLWQFMSVQIVIQVCQLLHEAVRISQTNYWEHWKMAFLYFSYVTENEFLRIFHLIVYCWCFFLTKVFNNYKIVRFTHWKRAKGVVRISWGCNLVLARDTKASIFGPTLSRGPVWQMGEHPPKLGTVSGISGATECLEWKT